MEMCAADAGPPLTAPHRQNKLACSTSTSCGDSGKPACECETGVFQASMRIDLVNEGPVTILLDSEKII
ncbi:MAG: D-aminoacyl-tRNA deacylase [Bryobacteraceae bacterium]